MTGFHKMMHGLMAKGYSKKEAYKKAKEHFSKKTKRKRKKKKR